METPTNNELEELIGTDRADIWRRFTQSVELSSGDIIAMLKIKRRPNRK